MEEVWAPCFAQGHVGIKPATFQLSAVVSSLLPWQVYANTHLINFIFTDVPKEDGRIFNLHFYVSWLIPERSAHACDE